MNNYDAPPIWQGKAEQDANALMCSGGITHDLTAQTSGGADALVMAGVGGNILAKEAFSLAMKIGEKLPPKVRFAIMNLIILAVLTACASGPAIIQTAAAQGGVQPAETQGLNTPTLYVSRTEEPTLRPTKTPKATATPTEVPIPEFMKDFAESAYSKQFNLQPGEERLKTTCFIDFDSMRKTDFYIGDLQILRVADCYFLNDKGQLQKISLPLAFYNRASDWFAIWGAGFDKGKPTEGYIKSLTEGINSARKSGGIVYAQFYMGDFKGQTQDYLDVFEAAVKIAGDPGDDFNVHGNASAFPNKPNAPKFVMPSVLSFSSYLPPLPPNP